MKAPARKMKKAAPEKKSAGGLFSGIASAFGFGAKKEAAKQPMGMAM